jgi:hypothetical protein
MEKPVPEEAGALTDAMSKESREPSPSEASGQGEAMVEGSDTGSTTAPTAPSPTPVEHAQQQAAHPSEAAAELLVSSHQPRLMSPPMGPLGVGMGGPPFGQMSSMPPSIPAMRPMPLWLNNDMAPMGMQPKRAPLRKGKWTIQEEQYVSKIILAFTQGLLNLPAGTTLRGYLSEKLHCDPMVSTATRPRHATCPRCVAHGSEECAAPQGAAGSCCP